MGRSVADARSCSTQARSIARPADSRGTLTDIGLGTSARAQPISALPGRRGHRCVFQRVNGINVFAGAIRDPPMACLRLSRPAHQRCGPASGWQAECSIATS
jgi:hypothetical protein